MKYSEIKPTIQQLHQAGWFKIKGVREYRKIWNEEGLRYGMSIDIYALLFKNLDVKRELEVCNERVGAAINEVLEKKRRQTATHIHCAMCGDLNIPRANGIHFCKRCTQGHRVFVQDDRVDILPYGEPYLKE